MNVLKMYQTFINTSMRCGSGSQTYYNINLMKPIKGRTQKNISEGVSLMTAQKKK